MPRRRYLCIRFQLLAERFQRCFPAGGRIGNRPDQQQFEGQYRQQTRQMFLLGLLPGILPDLLPALAQRLMDAKEVFWRPVQPRGSQQRMLFQEVLRHGELLFK